MSLPPPHPDHTVLVTGASAGIGAALARRLARRGHPLVLAARRSERLEELAGELARLNVPIAIEECDLADAGQRADLIARVREAGRAVVGLCNNAGVGSFGRFWELPFDREAEEVRLNVEALHELTGAFLPAMVERGAGAILNLGSLAGFQPQPSNATYAATKAFVNSFSEALHAELAGTGVSCTVMCPGPVKTEFIERAGVGGYNGGGPGLLWTTPEQVAESAVAAMVAGRRTAFPRPADRVGGLFGRLAPRTVMLPLTQRAMQRSVGRSGERPQEARRERP